MFCIDFCIGKCEYICLCLLFIICKACIPISLLTWYGCSCPGKNFNPPILKISTLGLFYLFTKNAFLQITVAVNIDFMLKFVI